MRPWLSDYWTKWTHWQRTTTIIFAIISAIVLYCWLTHSVNQARVKLNDNVGVLVGQQALMEQHATEIERLRATPTPAASQTDLRALVHSHIDAAGLGNNLTKLDMQDNNRIQVIFGAISFGDWIAWVKTLQSQYVRIEACRIEALSTPGMVGVTVKLIRSGSK